MSIFHRHKITTKSRRKLNTLQFRSTNKTIMVLKSLSYFKYKKHVVLKIRYYAIRRVRVKAELYVPF